MPYVRAPDATNVSRLCEDRQVAGLPPEACTPHAFEISDRPSNGFTALFFLILTGQEATANSRERGRTRLGLRLWALRRLPQAQALHALRAEATTFAPFNRRRRASADTSHHPCSNALSGTRTVILVGR